MLVPVPWWAARIQGSILGLLPKPPLTRDQVVLLINRERRTANVRAIVDTVCYEVAFDDLDDDLRLFLMANLAQQLSEKLLRVEREMRLLGG